MYFSEDLVLSGYEVPAGTHLDLNPSVHFRYKIRLPINNCYHLLRFPD